VRRHNAISPITVQCHADILVRQGGTAVIAASNANRYDCSQIGVTAAAAANDGK
jgi:hypothetical protein